MTGRISAFLHAVQQAARLVFEQAVSVNLWWLALAVVLYELAQVVRTRGWFNIIRAACPEAKRLRARDVAGAYLAGVGLNAVLPARGGDFLKLFMVRRRAPSARYSTLVATFFPETLFESVCGVALVVWALAHGFLPVPLGAADLPDADISLVLFHPLLSLAVAAAAGAAIVIVVRALRRRARDFAVRFRRGFAILRSPRAFVLGVATWQGGSRLIRLGSLAAFMLAVGLPVTLGTAILTMAAQGAGRIIPIAPASAGLRVAMLSYGFAEITDKPVDIASITGFWLTLGATHLIASVAIGLTVVSFTFGTLSPRRALAAARRAAGGAGAATGEAQVSGT